MQAQYIFRSLMIIGILACVILPFTFSKADTNYSAITLQPYTSSIGNYTIGLPQGWTTSTQDVHGVASVVSCTGPKKIDIDISSMSASDPIIDLSITPNLSKESPLKLAHNGTVKSMDDNRHSGLEASDAKETNIAGQEAYISTIKYKDMRGFNMKKMAGAIVTTWNGKGPITFVLTCAEKDYDKVYPVFQKCLETFTPGEGHQ